jgi:iron complex outermembrane receptor protein
MAPRAMAADTASGNSVGLEEVVVTAQRRTENLQDVPITIQAVSGEQLQRLNVTTMTELLKYTPNVTFSGNGAPGTGNIFMRGLSTGGSGNQSQSTTAPFPNVALYLDDQSMQFPARNNDVYLVDMERVEILEGPQGTLFGGGAQAGAVRYITNKPKLDQTGGTANASYGLTAGGDPNSSVNATLNVPLIDGKLAFRAVFFNDSRGGYIDNVPGAMSVPVYQTPPMLYGPPPGKAAGNPVAVNGGLAGTNTNTAAYQGGRLSALWKINDGWDALLQYNTQQFNAHGYWATEPLDPNGKALQPFETMAFAPAYEKDQYNSTALTVNGDLGFLKAVYSGSYLDRHIDGQQDYSNYLRSPHGSYYACSGKGAGYAYFGSGKGANASTKGTTCYAPQGSWRDQVQNTHQSHEVRFTTPTDKRLRALVGAFYENFIIYDRMDFNYFPIPQCSPENLAISAAGGPDCISAQGPMPGYYANDPSLRLNTNTAFGEDIRRGYSQTAFFGSVDFDIIPNKLTITGGTRHYNYDEFEQGSEYYSASSSVLNVPNGQGQRGFGINLKKSESGFKSRGNLTWHVTPDIMVYYTYSEGFRPGGFNRTKTTLDGTIKEAGVARYVSGGAKQYLKPYGYDSDNLINNEIGVKSEWLDHRLQLNATAYHMDWKNVQLPLFDPTHLGNTTFVVNGPTYRVEGIELQFVARVTEGLTIQGSSSWNSTDQTNTPCLASSGTASSAANPTPAGTCITQVNGQPYSNPFGNKGDRAAYSPALQYNVRARYDWDLMGYKAFVGAGMSHTSWQSNEPANFPNGDNPNQVVNTTLLKYTIPDYTTYDALIGVKKDAWTAQLAVINLTNNDAATSISSGQYIKQVVPLRPRLITFGMGYNF